MKVTKYFLVVVLLLALSSCKDKTTNPPDDNNNKPPGYQEDIDWPSLADSPWPMSHHDPQCTGRVQFYGPLSGIINWKINLTGNNSGVGFTDFVLGKDSTIYFGSSYENDNSGQMSYLYSVSINGNINWKFPLNHPFVNTSPVITSDGTIYIGSGDKNLYAINSNGELKWKYTADESIFIASMNIDKSGNIYFTTADLSLNSVDDNGTLRWKLFLDEGFAYSSMDGISFSPDGNILYISGKGTGSKSLYAITTNGEVKWTFGEDRRIMQPLIDSNGNIYFAYQNPNDTINSGFISLTSEGNKNWIYKTQTGIFIETLPTMDKDGNVYFSADSGITSLDYDGNFRWFLELINEGLYPFTALSCDSKVNIYFASDDNFVAVDSEGNLLYQVPISQNTYSSPAIGFNMLFLGSTDPKTIYSLR